jgi:MFS transporter, PPP family, 3-phenylpropionic acid transporter
MSFLGKLFRPEQRDLTLVRAYYFAFLGGGGFIQPFLNLFYVSLGLAGKQIGTFAALGAIVSLFIAPLWVNEVKKQPRPRRFLQLALALSACAYLLIANQNSFWPIAVIVLLQAVVASGIGPMSDSLAVKISQFAEAGYGSVRVLGSFGWIFAVLSSGWLIERLGFKAGFLGVSTAYLVAIALLFFIHPQHFSPAIAVSQAKTSLRVTAQRVFRDRTLAGFALALVFIGFLNNGVAQFENVFLSQLGASKSLISVAGIMSAIVELPFMLFADRIMRRFGAHRLLLLAVLMSAGLRLTVLSFPAIYTIMAVRFIGGTSFSLYTVAFVGLISERTLAHETGTVLALFTVTIAGLVNIIAAPVAGALYDAIGARWLYAFAMSGYLLAFISLWLTRPRATAQPLPA